MTVILERITFLARRAADVLRGRPCTCDLCAPQTAAPPDDSRAYLPTHDEIRSWRHR